MTAIFDLEGWWYGEQQINHAIVGQDGIRLILKNGDSVLTTEEDPLLECPEFRPEYERRKRVS